MRKGIKFLAVTGLCGFVLTCLMGLAEDGPAPEAIGDDFLALPPDQSEPAAEKPAVVRYTRNRDANSPAVDGFQSDPSAKLPAPPEPPTLPKANEFVPISLPPGEELIPGEFPESKPPAAKTSVNAPAGNPPASEQPRLEFVSGKTLFSSEPMSKAELKNPINAYEALTTGDPKDAAVKTAEQPRDLNGPALGQPATATVMPAKPAANFEIRSTTGPQTATISLEWVKRTEINVGQECQCDLVVKNTGGIAARNVTVEAAFPPSVRLLPATTPAPLPAGNRLRWILEDLAPNQTQQIQVHLIPTQRGELKASAYVHFTTAAATAFRVQEPLLEVALKGPKEVQVGDPASQIIQVSNPGTGTARNVEIKALIPPGLEHPQGKQLTMSIGSLNPGETRMVRLALASVTGGKHQIKVLAEAKLDKEAAPYLRKLSETEIHVISPSVKVAVDGPGLRYKNRNATFKVTVANDGTAVSNNVRVMHKVPAGFRFISATDGGKFDALSQTVAWFVGRIEPGQSSTMNVTLEAVKLGDFEHQVSAITDQGARSEDRIQTKIDGIASLALEVKDLNDPVEVGVATAYEIRVNNQGTKRAHNVTVACELPAGVELVDVKAPAKHDLQGGVLIFQPLPAIEAEKSAVYRIIVRGKSDGYQRFRARLASDSIQEPLLVEELTRFYGE